MPKGGPMPPVEVPGRLGLGLPLLTNAVAGAALVAIIARGPWGRPVPLSQRVADRFLRQGRRVSWPFRGS